MLDFKDYRNWLDLWTDDGLYIVPIERKDPHSENSLNYAYDNAEMRTMRVDRLLSGEAVSTQLLENTIRAMSRYRILQSDAERIKVRCAMQLYENSHGNILTYVADVTYVLRRTESGLKIEQKVVGLLNSNNYLQTIAYIL
jgi:3-phenylpropionate/cinnamic acid dioxygenase small subunit